MLKGFATFKKRAFAASLLAVLVLTAALALPAAAQATKKIDLNTADLKAIASLPGIGETLAQKIIDGRPFKKLDDLSAIKGIGQTKLDGLKGLVSFSKVEAVKETAKKTEPVTVKEKTKETAVKTKATEVKEENVLVNINKADLKTLQTLPGIGEALAQKIIDGRPYKTVEDLGKVKGIGEAKLKDLTGLVSLKDEVKAKAPKTTTVKETKEVDKAKETVKETAKETPVKAKETTKVVETTPGHVDINTADQKTLETLPGIGPALAQKIIAARPFKSVADLQNVSGIGEAKMKALKDLVSVGVANKPIPARLAPGEKLNINTATADQLDGLFGIGPVKSQAIVDYRTANGKFAAIEDIMKVKGIKEGEFAKIKDYIKIK